LNKPHHFSNVSRGNYTIFIIVTFIFWFSLFIYVPILAPYVEVMGGSYGYIGIVLSSYGFMQLLVRLPLGILSDFIKARRPFIMLGFITSVLSSFGLALTDQMEWALVFRAISGITASTWVAFTVLYASYFAQEDTTRAMSTMQLVTVTAQLTAMGLSGVIVEKWGWSTPFWLGGIGGIAGIILTFYIKESAENDSRIPMRASELTSVMKEPLLLKASLLSIFAHIILFITMFGFTPSYALTIGVSKNDLGFLVFSFMIPHALAAILSVRKIAPFIGQWMTLMIGFLGSVLFTFLIPFVDRFEWLCLTQAFNGLALGLTFPLLMGMSIHEIVQEKRATAMGFYQAVYAIGMFLGPFLAGELIESFGLSSGFFLAAIIGGIGALLSLLWNKSEQSLSRPIIKGS
jgi:DHA1 family multidrug resistance protein-like MFS transporter